MRSTGWRIEEPGWWTHTALGGVCRELDGKWYGYHKDALEMDRTGPFDTGIEAAKAVEAFSAVAV